MNRRQLKPLLALNFLLLGVLALVSIPGGRAGAQNDRPRSRGEYTMVNAKAQGISESCLYVVDSINQELLVLRWDRSRQQIKGIGYRDLVADALRASGATPTGR
jgi:hypothetical protein